MTRLLPHERAARMRELRDCLVPAGDTSSWTDENAHDYRGTDGRVVVTDAVEKACAFFEAPLPSPSAATFAAALLSSYDDELGCDLRDLPRREVCVQRVWAHVVVLDERGGGLGFVVAASIARRVTLWLLSR